MNRRIWLVTLTLATSSMVLLTLLLILSPVTRAADLADIVVDTLDDELNNDGDCSLREALTAANTNTPADACPAGDTVFTDTIAFAVSGIILLNEQLSVTNGGPLIIDGGGNITLSGNHDVRVLYVEDITHLTLESLSVVDGGSTNPISDDGPGIFIHTGDVWIITSTFSGNTGITGGGINNQYGQIRIQNSVFVDNSAINGAGIYNLGGFIRIDNSVISNNSWTDLGAGIFNDDGTMFISNSTITGNSAWWGGGVFNIGRMAISNTALSNNLASSGQGGGIWNSGSMTITNATISGNITHEYQDEAIGGGIRHKYGEMIVSNSTISGNAAEGEGGGIHSEGSLTIHNSSISNNIAPDGGGIYNRSISTLNLNNSTLHGNRATTGGAIFSASPGNVTLQGTIVGDSPLGDNCHGPITDAGYNIDSGDSCGFDPANDSLTNTDPRLGPLQDNGGATWSHALLFASPAIDAGDPLICPETDQRGVLRPIDGDGDGMAICDIGSVEIDEYEPVPISTVTIDGLTIGDALVGYTYTATVIPISATLPISYVWQASGQAPVTHTSGLTDTSVYIWDAPGIQFLTVTASNILSTVTDTHVITITDVSISDLVAINDSPTLLGSATTLSATISAGTNVTFTWDFGDESYGSGAVVTHTYPLVGVFTAIVTAGNSANTVTATTVVTIVEPIEYIYLPILIK